jgi:hypothetical protein
MTSMSTTPATPDGQTTLSHGSFEERGIRPIQPVAAPPRSTSVARLAERLEQDLGHSPEAAVAIAEAVEDPKAARDQTVRLSRVPVRGGTLYTLDVRANATRMIVDPINPRTVGATDYPASAVHSARAKYWAPRDLTVDAARRCELRLSGGTRQDVMDALDDAKSVLRVENPMSASIAANGVFFPLIVMPWIIDTAGDGLPPVAALVARDGSSRLNGAQENVGISPSDPLYGVVSDPRRSRGMVKEISDLIGRRQEEISNEQAARAHSLMVPARIIVGYDPDPGSDVDLLDVVDELVALIHLDRPTPWSPPSEANKRADIVLAELVEERLLSRRKVESFAGMVDRTEAEQAGLASKPDERAAEILHFFKSGTQTPIGKAISRGIRGLTRAGRVSKEDRASIFAPLMLRGHHWASANLRRSAESTLPRACQMTAFWDRYWAITGRNPEELRDSALHEIATGSRQGPAALELAALGLFWLTVHGGLGREAFGQAANAEKDNRSPSVVLAAVVGSEHGIHVLYQAVVDGRAGIPPRRVDESGSLAPDGSGVVPAISNPWLRDTFRPKLAGPGPKPNTGPSGPTAVEGLQRAVKSIRWKTAELVQQVADLRNLHGDGGIALVDEIGIPMQDVQAINEEFLIGIQQPLWKAGGIHQAHQTVPSAAAAVDDDLDGDDAGYGSDDADGLDDAGVGEEG